MAARESEYTVSMGKIMKDHNYTLRVKIKHSGVVRLRIKLAALLIRLAALLIWAEVDFERIEEV